MTALVARFTSSSGLVTAAWGDDWEAIVWPNGYGLWLVEFGRGRSWFRTDYVERTPLLLWWAAKRDQAPSQVQAWIEEQVPFLGEDYDSALPQSRLIGRTVNCDVISFVPGGETRPVFFARCTAPGCTYVSRSGPNRVVAKRWANAHDNDQPNDGRER